MYLITGSTGHVGSIVARELLLKGKKVRVIGRHGIKMKDLVNSGAEPLIGDLANPRIVKKAFEEISAAFCIMPPNNLSENIRKYRQEIARHYVEAVKHNGVKYVVLMSSIGAHIREGCGIVDSLADMEVSFSALKDVNVLNLRAGYFMENLFSELNRIRNSGIIGSTMSGDSKFPVIASKDVAEVVAKRLLALDFKGNTIEYVLGPRDISFNEIAGIIGNAIGRPELKYARLSAKDYKKWMVMSGYVSDNVADGFIKMEEAFNSGWAFGAHIRTRENSTPTTFSEFVKDIAYAYQQQPAA
jgi:uncharacterized protein YbjT (DUF2867 family)